MKLERVPVTVPEAVIEMSVTSKVVEDSVRVNSITLSVAPKVTPPPFFVIDTVGDTLSIV